MSKGIDLEILREIFKDDAVHISLALVNSVQFADDSSAVYVDCTLLPDKREILATMTWDSVGAGTGAGDMPDPNDLVLVAFADREVEHAFVIKRLASAEEQLHAYIKLGHYVLKAKPGKKLLLASDTKVEIGKGVAASPATEPLVLGNVALAAFGALADALLNAAQLGVCAVGPVMLDPVVRTALVAFKAQYVTAPTTNIVSQIAFTERGT